MDNNENAGKGHVLEASRLAGGDATVGMAGAMSVGGGTDGHRRLSRTRVVSSRV
jgi:hypothetical protein